MRPADAARLTALAAIWGSSYLLIKVALADFATLQIVAARLIIGAVVVIAFLFARGLRLPHGMATWAALVVMAVVGNIVPFLLITWGETRISSSLAAILNSTTPLFTAVLAAVAIPEEKIGVRRAAGIVLGFIGVGVIVGIDPAGGSVLAELAVVAAALSYAIGFVFARKRLTGRGGSPLRFSAGQLLISSVLMLPAAGWSVADQPPTPGSWSTASLVMLGLLGTGLAYVLYYRLVEDVGPTSASFVTYLIPVFGALLGRLALDERLGWNALAGATLVIAGIAVSERAVKGRDGLVTRQTVTPPEGAPRR